MPQEQLGKCSNRKEVDASENVCAMRSKVGAAAHSVQVRDLQKKLDPDQ